MTNYCIVSRVWLLFALFGWLPVAEAQWHIKPRGDDAGLGTPDQPLATLKRAVELSRQSSRGPSPRIVLHAGDYFGVSVRLGPEDHGLTIEAAPGEEPVLHGGELLTGFRPLEGGLVAVPIPGFVTSGGVRMLLVNGGWAQRARFPAQGRLQHRSEFNVRWMGTYGGGWERKPTTDELTTLRVDASILGRYFEPDNAELTVFHEWDESVVGVRDCNTNTGVIRFKNEAGHPPGAFGNRSFIIWNTRDGLTVPGQWMFDRQSHRIVYWPKPDEDTTRLQAVIPTSEVILNLEGQSNAPLRGITIRGVTFAVANTPLKAGGFGAYAFDGAITAEHLEDCLFTGLRLRHVGGNGIKLTHARGCRIDACEIENSGAGGILCQETANLNISNNRIHRVGRAYPSGIGLTCTGTSNFVTGNWVHDTTYVGITCDGFSAQIESNRVERVMLELHDGAGIYLGGTNHLIRANVCREIGQTPADRRHAYYMDELMRASRLEGNLAIQCPSPLHNHIASDIDIVNNVFLHEGDVQLSFFRCDGHRLERNLVVATGKIAIYRPEAVSYWSNNVFFSRTRVITGHPVERYEAGKPFPFRNPGVTTDVDPEVTASNDFQVSWPAGSPAARLGIHLPNVRYVGGNAGSKHEGQGTEKISNTTGTSIKN